MLILACLLLTGILKMNNVERAAKLLLDNLALFFVRSGVGLMLYFKLISAEFAVPESPRQGRLR
jgi:holin-like protein